MRSIIRIPLTIASATYRESMRQPAAIVTLLAAISVIVLSPNLGIFDLGEGRKIAVDTSLAAVLLAGLFTVLFAASQTVSAELQSRTALTLLAKPVSWEMFLLGKFLGVAAAGVTAILLLAMPVLIVARLSDNSTAEYTVIVEPSSVQAAEISLSSPDTPHPGGEVLRVFKSSDGSEERMVYLLFDIRSEDVRFFRYASLYLRWLGPEEVGDKTATSAKDIRAYTVENTLWSEETLAWRSQPRLGKRIAILPGVGPSREYVIPLSLRREGAEMRMLAVALKANGPVNAYFGGKGAAVERRSRLELKYYEKADPAAPFVIVGAVLVWLGCAILLGRGGRRSPYAAAAWGYAIACLLALVLLSSTVGWERFEVNLGVGRISIPGVQGRGPLAWLGFRVAGWDWPVLQGICLNSMEVMVLAAVGVAVAARAGRVGTFIVTLVVFAGGHVAGHWATRLAGGAPEGWKAVAVSILPNLEHFNLGDQIANGEILSGGLMVMAGAYAVLYSAAVMLVGMALIRGREVK